MSFGASTANLRVNPKYHLLVALLAVVYYATARAGLGVNALNTFATLVWPPSAISIAALTIFSRSLWPGVFLGAFLANFQTGASLPVALGIAGGNTLEALVGSYLLRAKVFDCGLQSYSDVMRLAFGAGMVSTAVSATIGVTSLWLGGIIGAADVQRTWFYWWGGDATAVVTMAPALLVFRTGLTFDRHALRKIPEAVLLSGLVLILSFGITGGMAGGPFRDLLLPFIMFPPLLWASMRFGQRGAALATLVMSGTAVWGVAHDRGALSFGPVESDILQLISFSITVALTSLMVAVASTQRKLAQRAAESANAAKTAFLANMSHEIRTPLGAVLGFSELLTMPGLSESERINNVEVIKRNGQHLSTIINDILDLSKVEAGKLETERIVVPTREIVADIASVLRLDANDKGLDLKVQLENDVPAHIQTDPYRLRQILINVVGNAIKFTARGLVNVRVFRHDGKLAFEVTDTGKGMTPEQSRKLFVPFSQADASTTRKFGGTGLGLALSKKLASLLGGDVLLAATKSGDGSKFLITIDAGDVKPGDVAPRVPSPVSEPQIKLENLSLLVVDDSLDNQVLVSRFLRMAGAKVDTASNGIEAVKKASLSRFDVILMDLQMPEMDGYEATKTLRRSGYRRKIIALTAHAMKEERRKCLESGFDEHITKPIDRNALLSMIAGVAGVARGAPQASAGPAAAAPAPPMA
ncbi:MAG TPA: MASE1 domain-containing protein [Bdellovibrionales bacterium]|nr:MASE1 domain-containing protein [Bdellovibrionales bacterium]